MVKVASVHERRFGATPERLAALVADFGAIWPTQIAPAPRPEGALLRVPTMRWQEFDRPGAVRAFRIVSPPEMRGEHWFEVEPVEGGTVLRHTIDGEATGSAEAMWRNQIEPFHDLVLEAMLDNVGRIVAAENDQGSGRAHQAAGADHGGVRRADVLHEA
jgi:hypothetical protein